MFWILRFAQDDEDACIRMTNCEIFRLVYSTSMPINLISEMA